MKKQIMTMAIMAASIFSMSAFAQTSNEGGACTQKKEMKCDKKKSDKQSDCKDRKQGDMKGAKGGKGKKDGGKSGEGRMASRQGRQMANPFEGLNLTAQQQQTIEAIPTPGKVMQTARQGAIANGQSAAATEASNRLIAKDIRAKYLQEVRSVLSADQYVQFLENSYVNSSAGGGKAKQMKQQAGRKGQGGDRQGNFAKGSKGSKDAKSMKGSKDFKGGDRGSKMTAQNR